MNDTRTTLLNSQATDERFSSSAPLAGGERCVDSGSSMGAPARGGILTFGMVEESIERLKRKYPCDTETPVFFFSKDDPLRAAYEQFRNEKT